MRRARDLAALACTTIVLLGGCAIGPNYERPPIPTPDSYRGWVGPDEAASLADLPWWEVFDDPALVKLVSVALEDNLDLRLSTARVEQSRALLGAARSGFFPAIGYTGRAGRQRVPLTSQPGQNHKTFDSFFGAFSLAWEIDVWGRIRRINEVARAELYAAANVRRGVLLSLVSEVALAYFDLLALDRQLEIAQETTAAFEGTLELFTRRYERGVGSKVQTARAAAALAETAAAIPQAEARIAAAENQISVLLGRPPGPIARGAPLVEQRLPPSTPPGLSAALLERRPDVMQAEEQVVAANARVGVAMGNFLPRLGLTTLYGGATDDLEDLVSGRANLWNVVGEATGPLFQGGLLLSEYRAQESGFDEAVANYEKVVLVALAEISDALVAQRTLAAERVQRERAVVSLQEALELALVRYRQGLASYYEVLDAQQQLFPAELLLADVLRDEHNTVVRLYAALGGGWQLDESWLPPTP